VYAARDIGAGELLCYYAGELLTEAEFAAREDAGGWSAHAIAIHSQELLERLEPPGAPEAAAAPPVRRDRRRADQPRLPPLIIDAAARGGIARDINDPRAAHPERAAPAYRGRQANCEYCEALDLQTLTPLVFIAASRDIPEGEEVCVEYGDAFWARHAILELPAQRARGDAAEAAAAAEAARADAAEAEASAEAARADASEAEAAALRRQLAALMQRGG
jgi:SET domain-containing protein